MPIKKLRLIGTASLIILLSFPAQAESFTISGYGKLRDMGCDGMDAIIEGVQHGLNLTGACGALIVAGVENGVDFESANFITLSGSANKIEGALVGPAPQSGPDVLLSGSENVLTLRFDRPAVVEISGTGNRLIWAVSPGIPIPEIRITGENNEAVD